MTFYLIGIDYKTVSSKVRESAYRLRREIEGFCRYVSGSKAAVLFTCNRIEVYGIAADPYEARIFVNAFKRRFSAQFENAYALYGEDEVFRYGLRLACGLESRLAGEFQIMQQLESWVSGEGFPILLKDTWARIISEARRIRISMGLDKGFVNIAKIIFEELQQHIIFADSTNIVVIGTGKVAALVAENSPTEARLFFVAHKKRSKARRLADSVGGKALLPDDLPEYLITADAVICATSSPHYVLKEEDFIKAINVRQNSLYVYDAAVPRDVSPGVYNIPFVRVRDLDNLTSGRVQRSGFAAKRIDAASSLVEEVVNAKHHKGRYAAEPTCLKTG